MYDEKDFVKYDGNIELGSNYNGFGTVVQTLKVNTGQNS